MTISKHNDLEYNQISRPLQERIAEDRARFAQNPYKCQDADAVRRDPARDEANLWRPAFVRDIEKILHLPFYNRYADKTQVFSFYSNDDITRRALHVQLVSRIARNIGAVLGLNLDLIEAIALGHDLGHTPFGHAGEKYLGQLLHGETGRFFNHNVHSARVLDKLFVRNVSLQTLDGILCHNGEFEQQEYRPKKDKTFAVHDREVEACYVKGKAATNSLVPMSLEGCVVRICDMIAYLGKDRQDARTAKLVADHQFKTGMIGTENAAIINNLTVDIIENSYSKDHILLSEAAYRDLKTAKKENYAVIYNNEVINEMFEADVGPMFKEMYYRLLDDVKRAKAGDESSVVFKHHIEFIGSQRKYYVKGRAIGDAEASAGSAESAAVADYLAEEANQIVVDYIASMTDDYFVELHKLLFPDSKYRIEYKSYFEDLE